MSWVKPETHKDRLISMIAICGEMPVDQLTRLPGGYEYKISIIKQLKKKHMIKTFYKDGLRGLRLLLPAKDELLKQNDERFSFYLTGVSETNHIRSEVPRRLRLHRMAETLITMQNGKVEIYRDNKPHIFAPERIETRISYPAFYSSREIKEMGIDTIKIKGARSMGTLMTESRIYAVYNIGDSLIEWDYKAEMRYKALLKTMVCQDRMKHQYSVDSIDGLVLGNSMELAAEILRQTQNENYFLMDGGYPHFYFLTNDYKGERILQMMCSTEKNELMLDLLGDSYYDQDPTYPIENDAIDEDGNPVLFACTCDLVRIKRFINAIDDKRRGTIVCFDFQKDILQSVCNEQIELKIVSFEKWERRLFLEEYY